MVNRIETLILKKEGYPDAIKKDLASYTGLHINTIRKYCRNRNTSIDARNAILIAKFFGISVAELYEEPKKSKQKIHKTV